MGVTYNSFLQVRGTQDAWSDAPAVAGGTAALTDYPALLGARRVVQETRGVCEYALRFNDSGSTIPFKSALKLGTDGQSCLINATAILPSPRFGGIVQESVIDDGVAHATGVPTGHWFWAQVKGPCECIADTGGFTAGEPAYADTTAASGVIDASTAITTVALGLAVIGVAIDTVVAGATGTIMLDGHQPF